MKKAISLILVIAALTALLTSCKDDDISPVFVGCQDYISEDKLNIRFVSVSPTTEFKNTGYNIYMTYYADGGYNETEDIGQPCEYTHEKITGKDADGNTLTYTSQELNGAIIITLVLNNVQIYSDMEFKVVPYYMTEGGEKIEGEAVKVYYVNGALSRITTDTADDVKNFATSKYYSDYFGSLYRFR